MAITLTLGGTNFLPQYQTSSGRITANLYNQGNSMSCVITQKTGQSAPTPLQEIVFKDGARFLFGGYITKVTPTETGKGQLIKYQVEASDYTALLVNKYAAESYENQTLGYIVNDLVTKYIDGGYAITQANVATGPTIPTVLFNHVSLRQCFETLSKLTGYTWWIDYQKDIHFIDATNTTAAPETITDSNTNIETVNITIDTTQVRNSITVLGGNGESAAYPYSVVGDSTTRAWTFPYTSVTLLSVKLNGVTKAFGVDPEAEGANYAMHDKTNNQVRLAVASATPTGVDTLDFTYSYALQAVAFTSDPTSIAACAAIEGGDGIHSYTINDTSITSIPEAELRGQKELVEFSNPILSGKFVTRTGLLTAGSYFVPGQYLTVNLPTWGINSDTRYTVQRVLTTLDEGPSSVEYHYEVTFGGRLLGLVDFLIALATPKDLNTTDTVVVIKQDSSTITITESIARGSAVGSDSATITITEGIYNDPLGAGVSPTWVLGPYFPSPYTDTKRVINLDRDSAKLG